MKHRIITTDHNTDGGRTVDHHEVDGGFEEARAQAEQMRDKHAVVSICRYTGGEPDLLWSTRAEPDS